MSWDDFWFRPIPPHIYGALRLAFGVLGIVNLLGATPVSMFWDVNGIAPIPGGGSGARAIIAGAGLGSAVGWVLFVGSFLAYACMAAGIFAQAAVVVSFLASVGQTLWNPLPLSSAHQVLTVVLFTLVWADCGQVLTLGGTAAKSRGRERPPRQPIWPLRLLQYQVCLIYVNSGLWKFFGAPWRDGSATHYALSHNVFQRFPGEVPAWVDPLSIAGTYITLAWEIAFPILVLSRRTRAWALGLGVLLHLGVWATIEVGPFSWMMIASYLAFLDPEQVATVVDRLRGAPPRDTEATAGAVPAQHEAAQKT